MRDLYIKITTLNDLSPSEKVNFLFSQLVEKSLEEGDKNTTLTKSETAKLQLICARAEYEMEKYWAKRILEAIDSNNELLKFPYYSNYEKLTQMEWFSLLSCTKHIKHKAIFVGSGPLPLTAIVLAKKYTSTVTVLDVDKEACELSRKLIKKLGLEKKIRVINEDGVNFESYKEYNLIFIAALAGVDIKTKENILKKIRKDTEKGIHILARSSWGMREILYKPLDKKLFKLFKPIIEVRPHNDVVNSVIVFENI